MKHLQEQREGHKDDVTLNRITIADAESLRISTVNLENTAWYNIQTLPRSHFPTLSHFVSSNTHRHYGELLTPQKLQYPSHIYKHWRETRQVNINFP